MARKQTQSAIAKSIPPAVTDSTLATLGERATTASATQGAQHALQTGNNFTGQYLFDRFVANDEAELSKMAIVRQMVNVLDLASAKAVLSDFVGIAKNLMDNAIATAKQAGTYNKDDEGAVIGEARAKYKTAQNHQTVMRMAYGAIKFAPESLAQHGYNDTTGYQAMRVIAKASLEGKGLKWDGTKVPTKTDKERKEALTLSNKALTEVQADNPQLEGESRVQWLTRIDEKVEAKIAELRTTANDKIIADLTAKIRTMAGSYLDEVLEALLSQSSAPVLDPVAAQAAAATAVVH